MTLRPVTANQEPACVNRAGSWLDRSLLVIGVRLEQAWEMVVARLHLQSLAYRIRVLALLCPLVYAVGRFGDSLREWHQWQVQGVTSSATQRATRLIDAEYRRAVRQMNREAGRDWQSILD